jgi:hypothetical protein
MAVHMPRRGNRFVAAYVFLPLPVLSPATIQNIFNQTKTTANIIF